MCCALLELSVALLHCSLYHHEAEQVEQMVDVLCEIYRFSILDYLVCQCVCSHTLSGWDVMESAL